MSATGSLRRAAGGGFGVLSYLRGKRIFHPQGVVLSGTLVLDRHEELPPGPLTGPARHEGVVARVSRGAGLPPPTPDLFGLAVKIPRAHRDGKDQDLVLATSGRAAVARNLLVPALRLSGQLFSSVLPYRADGRLVLFGARATTPGLGASLEDVRRAAENDEVRFELLVARLVGPWRRIGELRLTDPVPDAAARRIRFNPWNTGAGVRPYGPLNRLRSAAYRASQVGRSLRRPRRGETEAPRRLERVDVE